MDGVVLLSQRDWTFLHAEGGPFDPCDKLIHPSTCLKLHPMVGIGSSCVSLYVGADATLDDQPNLRVATSEAHWRDI